MIAIPAMFSTVAIIYFSFIEWIFCFLQKIFHQIYRVVEIVVIHVAAEDMKLAFELGTEGLPVTLKDVPQIIILFPITGDFRVNVTGFFIEYPFWISIVTLG